MAYSIFDSIIPVEQLTHQEPTLHHHVLVSILSYSGVTAIILRFFQTKKRERKISSFPSHFITDRREGFRKLESLLAPHQRTPETNQSPTVINLNHVSDQ